MIKTNELRLGNLFQDKFSKDYFKVLELTEGSVVFDYFTDKVWQADPIELTEEILLKCGFIEDDFNKNGGLYLLLKNTCLDGHLDYFYLKKGLNVVNLRSIRSVEIKNLHQLQNLYFALTNEELTIEL